MKKLLAIVLAMLMVLTLFACGTKDAGSSTAPETSKAPETAAPETAAPETAAPESASTVVESGQANTGDTGSQPLDKVGFYDPDYDYTQNEKWTVQYMVAGTGGLWDRFDRAFRHWAGKMNLEYNDMWSATDIDVFINGLQTFIDQGVDAFLLDPDPNLYKRIDEICDEAGVFYIGCMSPARDMEAEGTPMIGPFVGFDYYWFGTRMGEELVKYAKKNWPDVPMEEIGFIGVDFSTYPALHDRCVGAYDYWVKETGLDGNYYQADTVSLGPTLDAANTMVTSILSTETQYSHWLCATLYDDMAQGAAAAFETVGLGDVACVTTVGGDALVRQWDDGIESAWKFAMYTAQTIYAEPIIGALYSWLKGESTPETIWPSWINPNDHGAGDARYASLLLPSYVMTKDDYQLMLEWSDIYAGSEEYNYDQTGITRETFNARMNIPDSYKVEG
jgi:ABC-type sugar transport system substrate-binding protein